MIQPDGVRTYQIVVAGALPLRNSLPVFGTSNIRVTLRHRIAPTEPEDLHHTLLEFTYDGHEALFERSDDQSSYAPGFYVPFPDLWPSHGFIVKATLLTLPEPFTTSSQELPTGWANRQELQNGGLASLLAAPDTMSSARWDWNNPATVAVELIARTGITLRVSSRRPMYTAQLLVEVSWCDRFRP